MAACLSQCGGFITSSISYLCDLEQAAPALTQKTGEHIPDRMISGGQIGHPYKAFNQVPSTK